MKTNKPHTQVRICFLVFPSSCQLLSQVRGAAPHRDDADKHRGERRRQQHLGDIPGCARAALEVEAVGLYHRGRERKQHFHSRILIRAEGSLCVRACSVRNRSMMGDGKHHEKTHHRGTFFSSANQKLEKQHREVKARQSLPYNEL